MLFRVLLCDERIVHRLTNYQSFLSYTSGCSSRLAALDSRLLKYSRILEISLPSTFPFSSISLSLWANIFQISIRSPSSKSRGDLKGDHPRRKIVHSSICKTMHDNRCKDREAKAFLDFPGRPPANLFPPYVDGELVPRWIFLSFYERGERKSKKKIDENENPLDLSSSWRWQLTCLLKW